MANEETQNHQEVNINVDRMTVLINEELVSVWDIMFWRGTSNPQTGRKMTIVAKPMSNDARSILFK